MAKANPLWGAPRIHGELLKLGIDYVSERTVSNIIRKCRPPKPPSQTWRTFLKNHMHNTFAIDFFTVPTATFTVLYVSVIIPNQIQKFLDGVNFFKSNQIFQESISPYLICCRFPVSDHDRLPNTCQSLIILSPNFHRI